MVKKIPIKKKKQDVGGKICHNQTGWGLFHQLDNLYKKSVCFQICIIILAVVLTRIISYLIEQLTHSTIVSASIMIYLIMIGPIVYELIFEKHLNTSYERLIKSFIVVWLIYFMSHFVTIFIVSCLDIFPRNFNAKTIIDLIVPIFMVVLISYLFTKLVDESIKKQYINPAIVSLVSSYLVTRSSFGIVNPEVLGISIGTLTLALIFLFVYPFYLQRYYREDNSVWLLITLFIISITLVIGFQFIDNTYGAHPIKSLDFELKNETDSPMGIAMNCTSLYPEIYVGSIVNCTTSTPLKIIESQVRYTTFLGEDLTENFSDGSFVISSKPARYGVELKVDDILQNKTVYLYGDSQVEIKTEEEIRNDRKQFLTYLFGLIGVVLLTIPQMMGVFRGLLQKK
jgi:hypothetical protein